MAPTTVTTLVMIVFALGVFALTAYAYLGSWEVQPRRSPAERRLEAEYWAAVLEMRRGIEEYEAGRRPL